MRIEKEPSMRYGPAESTRTDENLQWKARGDPSRKLFYTSLA